MYVYSLFCFSAMVKSVDVTVLDTAFQFKHVNLISTQGETIGKHRKSIIPRAQAPTWNCLPGIKVQALKSKTVGAHGEKKRSRATSAVSSDPDKTVFSNFDRAVPMVTAAITPDIAEISNAMALV